MTSTQLRTFLLLATGIVALPAHAQYSFGSVASTATIGGATAFSSNNRSYINNSGNVSFTATVSSNTTLFKNIAGSNTVVAAQSGSTPYGNGSTYGTNIDAINVTLDDSNRVTYRGDGAVGTGTPALVAGDNTAIVRDSTVVSREGTTAVDSSTPNTFSNYDANNSATTAYAGTLNAGGNSVFSVTSGGVFTRLISSGTAATGTNANFNTFSFVDIDNSGNVSFQSALTGGTTAGGLFTVTAGGATSKIAALGETDTGGVSTYSAFFGIARSDAGTIAATATAGGLRGVYAGTGNSLTSLVAQQGQTILGATYSNGLTLGNINANGIGVFRATSLTGGTFTSAIFTFNAAGQVSKVLAQGDPVFGSTASAFGIPTINDSGFVAFNYTLANASQGVLVAVVPEAGTMALLLAGGSLLGGVLVSRRKKA